MYFIKERIGMISGLWKTFGFAWDSVSYTVGIGRVINPGEDYASLFTKTNVIYEMIIGEWKVWNKILEWQHGMIIIITMGPHTTTILGWMIQ